MAWLLKCSFTHSSHQTLRQSSYSAVWVSITVCQSCATSENHQHLFIISAWLHQSKEKYQYREREWGEDWTFSVQVAYSCSLTFQRLSIFCLSQLFSVPVYLLSLTCLFSPSLALALYIYIYVYISLSPSVTSIALSFFCLVMRSDTERWASCCLSLCKRTFRSISI